MDTKEEIREITIESLDELIRWVTPASPDPDSGRRRDYSVYRGTRHAPTSLLTSLDRLGMPVTSPHAKAHLEEHLLRNFIRYSRAHLESRPSNDWEFLVIAQHHGLPTRLLDWTYSPVIAAHFATVSDENGPGVIWRLDWRKIHEHFAIPSLALTVEDLHRTLCEKGYASLWDFFRRDASQEALIVCMLEPPALDHRILLQSATFTLCSDKTRSLDDILVSAGLASALTRFVVPNRRIGYMRDQLDMCGINEQRLFPDLGGVAAAMRRYYSSSLEPRSE
jgi:hypothetical protein